MTQKEKDILYAKADTLRWSIQDTQLQAVVGIVVELIGNLEVDDKQEMGFKASEKTEVNA